ncbi:hypothetical protein L3Q82_023569 [Scortum barcoo]|uniref:Uncharacterized protein n=1 Tax=Scortum barcoo TaxID=214431 RepID=A0ACB8WTW6_9TELE|nr:hypothetical protein L3Q82_023569 [Scortum barcoo]
MDGWMDGCFSSMFYCCSDSFSGGTEEGWTGLQAAPADHCYAGPEDVACDFCTGRKLKAVKSCLQCLASYCEKHLQPHYESPTFKKHKLVDPSKKLQENICSRHDEVMKMFCRTDQQEYLLSLLCGWNIKATTQSQLQQKGLRGRESSRPSIALLIKQWKDSEKIFSQLIRLIQKRSSDVKQQLRSQQETEVSRVKELQEKLEQEITELKRKDADLKQLSHTEDHTQFLHNYPSLSALSQSTDSSSIKIIVLSDTLRM